MKPEAARSPVWPLTWLAPFLWASTTALGQAPVPYYQPVPVPITPAQYRLGISMQNVNYWEPAYGWIRGIQVTGVDPGSAAQRNRIEPGDIITRVDGLRTVDYRQVQSVIAGSNGTVTLRLKDHRTGRYVDTPPIELDGAGPMLIPVPVPPGDDGLRVPPLVPDTDPPPPPEEDLTDR